MTKMPAPSCITIDFETEAIAQRPKYPPLPVGFSIREPGSKTKYYAWGHISHNNCTKAKAQQVLRGAWRNAEYPLLFQNAKFDYDVATTHMGMTALPWERMHDTLYLLFLENPYAASLSLKPSAERLLKLRSSERDDLKTWIINNIPEAKRKPSSWGAYIARAPGNIVGRYADGDVLRTERLFEKLYPIIAKRSMLQAYDRERHVMPYLLLNEQTGVRVDLRKMERDVLVYQAALDKADVWLRRRLGVKDLNLDADRDVGEALDKAGIVTEWTPTKTGKKSVAKKNMTLDRFNDVRVASAYAYRNMLRTCLSMFLEPWLAIARQTNGIIYTTWNQVRQSHEEKNVGARTGRLSSTPNFQNVPKNWEKAIAEGYVHPTFLNVPPLPLMRQYFLPDSREHLWGRRDYNQQELRILAHFEDGSLLQEYNANPRLDIHAEVQAAVLEVVGIKLSRTPTKILNFADIYGRGIGTLAESMHVTVEIAKQLRKVKDVRFPDVKILMASVKERGKAGLPIRTWGGREYYTEPARYSEKYGREMSFEYKLLNYLIQGSASDCTKESIIRYHEHPKAGPRTGDARFLITVHDENNISGHKKVFAKEMALLREVMQSVEFDTPMLSDGESGANWGDVKKLKEPEYVRQGKARAATA